MSPWLPFRVLLVLLKYDHGSRHCSVMDVTCGSIELVPLVFHSRITAVWYAGNLNNSGTAASAHCRKSQVRNVCVCVYSCEQMTRGHVVHQHTGARARWKGMCTKV